MDKLDKLLKKVQKYIRHNSIEADGFIEAIIAGIKSSNPDMNLKELENSCIYLDKRIRHNSESIETVLNASASYDWFDYTE